MRVTKQPSKNFHAGDESTWNPKDIAIQLEKLASKPFLKEFFGGWDDAIFKARCLRIVELAESVGVDVKAKQASRPSRYKRTPEWEKREKVMALLLEGEQKDRDDFTHPWMGVARKPKWWVKGMCETDKVRAEDKRFSSMQQALLTIALLERRHELGLGEARVEDTRPINAAGKRQRSSSVRSEPEAPEHPAAKTARIRGSSSRDGSCFASRDAGFGASHTPKPKYKEAAVHIITLDVADNGRDRSRMTVRIDDTTTADLEKAFDIDYRYVADSRELLHDQLLNVLDVPTAVPTAQEPDEQLNLYYRRKDGSVAIALSTRQARHALKSVYGAWDHTNEDAMHLYLCRSRKDMEEVPQRYLKANTWPEEERFRRVADVNLYQNIVLF